MIIVDIFRQAVFQSYHAIMIIIATELIIRCLNRLLIRLSSAYSKKNTEDRRAEEKRREQKYSDVPLSFFRPGVLYATGRRTDKGLSCTIPTEEERKIRTF